MLKMYRLKFDDGVCSAWQTNYADIVESARWYNENTYHHCEIETRTFNVCVR